MKISNFKISNHNQNQKPFVFDKLAKTIKYYGVNPYANKKCAIFFLLRNSN